MGIRSFFKRRKQVKTTSSSSSSLSSSSMKNDVVVNNEQQVSSSFHYSSAEELKYVFKKFDTNGDGLISASELGSMMKTLGHPATEEELNKMIRDVDFDGDGHINVEEFIELNTKGVDPDEVDLNLKDAFAIFDVDGNGSITANELHTVMVSLGDHCSLEECQKMIAAFDGDANGMLNFAEFKKMMTSD